MFNLESFAGTREVWVILVTLLTLCLWGTIRFLLCCYCLFHHTPPLVLLFRLKHTHTHTCTQPDDNMNTHGPLTLPVSQEPPAVESQSFCQSYKHCWGSSINTKELSQLSHKRSCLSSVTVFLFASVLYMYCVFFSKIPNVWTYAACFGM